jgi:hypothetical protein
MAAAYWMPRWSLSSGGARADPMAGHDDLSRDYEA